MDSKICVCFTHLVNRARWTFPVHLVSTLPTIDDTIIIQGAAKKTASVTFTLKNPLNKPIAFKSYFLKRRGPCEMNINPTEGTLIQEGNQGSNDNQFTVSYNPTSNGKSFNAIMVVDTDEFALFYEVRGVTPVVKRK
jgi:hypothetical protein